MSRETLIIGGVVGLGGFTLLMARRGPKTGSVLDDGNSQGPRITDQPTRGPESWGTGGGRQVPKRGPNIDGGNTDYGPNPEEELDFNLDAVPQELWYLTAAVALISMCALARGGKFV